MFFFACYQFSTLKCINVGRINSFLSLLGVRKYFCRYFLSRNLPLVLFIFRYSCISRMMCVFDTARNLHGDQTLFWFHLKITCWLQKYHDFNRKCKRYVVRKRVERFWDELVKAGRTCFTLGGEITKVAEV